MIEKIYVYIADKRFEQELVFRNVEIADEKTVFQKNAILITDDDILIKNCNIPYLFYLHEGNLDKSLPSGSFCAEVLSDIDEDYLERIYKRFYNLPWKILETDRLIIEEISEKDVYELKKLYDAPEVTLYMEDLFPLEEEIEYTRSYIKNVYAFYGFGMWLLKLKDSGIIIGRAGVEIKEGFDGLELGFMLGKDYWHKGYASEACEAVINYASHELEMYEFRALVHEKNEASKRVCERLGFTRYGMQDNHIEYRLVKEKE